ncbi:MAG: cytochrome c oxidase assembly protein [Gemmatimonadota bacterium]
MTWWCAATDLPWSWTWRPYPGVWLFVALMVAGYTWLRIRRGDRAAVEGWGGRHVAFFALGTLALWLALDWPIGTLGAGYLASVHTVQYLLLALVAPPLMLLGFPSDFWQRLDRNSVLWRLARRFASPLPGFLVYNGVVVTTHIPQVVDGLMVSQWGSFLVDTSWFVAGLTLWWPVLAPDGVGRTSPLGKIGYLFASTIIPTAPAMFLVFADYPVYAIYEKAPRVGEFTATSDQQLAGLLMKLAADPILWVAMTVLFFRWSREQNQDEPV